MNGTKQSQNYSSYLQCNFFIQRLSKISGVHDLFMTISIHFLEYNKRCKNTHTHLFHIAKEREREREKEVEETNKLDV